MKYTAGGIIGRTGVALLVEVPVAGRAAPSALAEGPKADPNDPTRDKEFVEGTDVSSAQNPDSIRWDEVSRSGRRFVYAQLGMTPEARAQPRRYPDEDKFGSRHIRNARAAGLHVGAYQYGYFRHPPVRDAEIMIKAAEGLGLDLPFMLDAEQAPGDWGCNRNQVVDWIRKWVRRVTELAGRKPIIYTGKYWWEGLGQGGQDPEWTEYDLWLAQYGTSKPNFPKPWARWTFWQYLGNTIWHKSGQIDKFGPVSPGPEWVKIASPGKVPGMPGEVDVDQFNGSLAAFDAWRTGGAVQPSPPQPKPATPNLSTRSDDPPARPQPVARPDYPLLPEDLKAKYLNMAFTLDGQEVRISLEHLKYHNVKKNPSSKRDDLIRLIQHLVTDELQRNNMGWVDETLGTKLGRGSPDFAVWPFLGKGSPQQIEGVLKVVGHFGKARLGANWPGRATLSENLTEFYAATMGLDCNGFAGNYSRAIGGPRGPDDYIPRFAPAERRRRELDQILPGDVIVWNDWHIATIQGRRSDGNFDIVESNGEPEVQGLGNTVRGLKETGGDVFRIQKIHADGSAGRTEDVWVATLK